MADVEGKASIVRTNAEGYSVPGATAYFGASLSTESASAMVDPQGLDTFFEFEIKAFGIAGINGSVTYSLGEYGLPDAAEVAVDLEVGPSISPISGGVSVTNTEIVAQVDVVQAVKNAPSSAKKAKENWVSRVVEWFQEKAGAGEKERQ